MMFAGSIELDMVFRALIYEFSPLQLKNFRKGLQPRLCYNFYKIVIMGVDG